MVHSITESHALDISIYVLIMILLSWVPPFRLERLMQGWWARNPLASQDHWKRECGSGAQSLAQTGLCVHLPSGPPVQAHWAWRTHVCLALPPSYLTAVCFVQKRARWLLSVPDLGQSCSMGMASGALTAAPCLITGGHWSCWLGQD